MNPGIARSVEGPSADGSLIKCVTASDRAAFDSVGVFARLVIER